MFLLFCPLTVLSTSSEEQKSSDPFSLFSFIYHFFHAIISFRFTFISIHSFFRAAFIVTQTSLNTSRTFGYCIGHCRDIGRSVQCKRTNEKEAGRGEKNKIMAMKRAAQNDRKTPNCTYIDVLCNLSYIQGTRKYNVNIL